jgi:hypothetical protein
MSLDKHVVVNYIIHLIKIPLADAILALILQKRKKSVT